MAKKKHKGKENKRVAVESDTFRAANRFLITLGKNSRRFPVARGHECHCERKFFVVVGCLPFLLEMRSLLQCHEFL